MRQYPAPLPIEKSAIARDRLYLIELRSNLIELLTGEYVVDEDEPISKERLCVIPVRHVRDTFA